jgi:hypothetical protein
MFAASCTISYRSKVNEANFVPNTLHYLLDENGKISPIRSNAS